MTATNRDARVPVRAAQGLLVHGALLVGLGLLLSACPGSSTAVTNEPGGSTPPGGGGGPGGPTPAPASQFACNVQQLLVDRCSSCHGAVPSEGAPMPLRTLHDLRLSSHLDGKVTQAQRSLIRMRDDALPMPPAPHAPATAEEIALLEGWIEEGMLSCTEGPGGAPIAFESPNLLDQASLFSCSAGTQSDAPTRVRRLSRLEFTRNVGGAVTRNWTGFSFNDNPLDHSAIEQYSTWATDETLDEATVELFLPVVRAAGPPWAGPYAGGNRLVRLREDRDLACMWNDASPSDACMTYYLGEFLEHGVFFRPPTDDDVARLRAFARQVISQESDGEDVRTHSITRISNAAWLMTGALFRQEMGVPDGSGRVELTPHELAQQLTYALGRRGPGATPAYVYPWYSAGSDGHYADVAAAAADGSLLNPSVAEALFRANVGGVDDGTEGDEARFDLLVDESVERRRRRGHHWLADGAAGFFREWLGYEHVAAVFKERPAETSKFRSRPNASISYSNLLEVRYGHESSFVQQLDDTIARIVMEDTDVLRTLLTTRRFYLPSNQGANFKGAQATGYPYGVDNDVVTIPATVQGRWVTLPSSERAGVLTHPAWLAAHGGNFEDDPSIVHRGLWVRENLLCDYVPPLSSVQVDAQVGPHAPELNARRRLQQATAGAQCQGCHRLMEPLGLPFEIYNHAGFLRERDHAPDGGWTAPDGSSTLVAMPEPALEGPVSDAIDLVERLADSQHVKRCFVRQAFRYYMGRPENLTDACTLTKMEQAYDADGGSFISMIGALISSDTWTTRREPQAGD